MSKERIVSTKSTKIELNLDRLTCKLAVAGRRVQHVLWLRDGLKVRQGGGHDLAVAERQVHHLVIRDVTDGYSQDSLRSDSWER